MRWRRGLEAVVAPAGLSFTQWLVLEALRQLISETGDAVNQNEVARRLELDRMTISAVMRRLEQKQWVDRASDLTGRAWRIFLTRRAAALLRQQSAEIEALSLRPF